ncbi:hypothetical protein KCP73_14260 [Salmonella enterica subsp. enterica]|nr:hypothetical protein KCP73_14260 [Salmonella enterica subsp. enterica]
MQRHGFNASGALPRVSLTKLALAAWHAINEARKRRLKYRFVPRAVRQKA